MTFLYVITISSPPSPHMPLTAAVASRNEAEDTTRYVKRQLCRREPFYYNSITFINLYTNIDIIIYVMRIGRVDRRREGTSSAPDYRRWEPEVASPVPSLPFSRVSLRADTRVRIA